MDAPLWLNFPQPTPAAYTVPITVTNPTSAPMANVSVAITDSEGNTVSGSPFTSAAETGALTGVSLNEGTYNYTATPSAADAALYAVTNGSFTVSKPASGTEATAVTIKMNYVPAEKKNITIKVVDGDNENALIPTAAVNLGGTEKNTTDGTVLYELSPNVYSLQVTAAGYETFGSKSENVITIGSDVTFEEAYASSLLYDADTQTVTVVLSARRTAITIPVPVPSDGEKPIDVSQAGHLKVTISANPDESTPATLALPITVTTTVDPNGNILNFAPESGTMTSLSALVNLPKGNYILTVSGAGIEDTDTTLNVVPNGNGTTVNVGGAVTDGKVNGGYTDTTTNDSIDLGSSSGNATTGGSIDGSGAVSGGSSATGGLGGNGDAAGLPGVTVITDPLYYVVGTWNTGNTEMTVQVYLKNIAANYGTFGLRYDPNIFTLGDFKLSDKVQIDGLTISSSGSGGTKLDNPVTESGYHDFVWIVSDAGGSMDYLDTTEAPALIATYTMTVKKDVNLATAMHNEALYVMPYDKTSNDAIISGAYGGKNSSYTAFMTDYWRNATADVSGEGLLIADKASGGGFFRVFTNKAGDPTESIAYDVRSQFVFEDYGNVAVHVTAQNAAGNGVTGATVTLTAASGGAAKTGTTDANGETIIAWPANTDLKVGITAPGYLPFAGKDPVDVSTGAVHAGPYTLITQEGHPVVVKPGEMVTLSGESKAYNSVPYSFTLSPAPGYEWADGHPLLTDLTITIADADTNNDDDGLVGDKTLESSEYTWNAVTNRYEITGAAIVGNAKDGETDAGNLTVTVDNAALQPAGTSNEADKYKVTATAGEGGIVHHEESGNDPASSFTGNDVTGTIVETLGAGMSTSAVYTFTPNAATQDMQTAGTVYVIDKIFINGAAMTPSDTQRREGFSYQFTGITGDQTITVTFGTMPEDGGDITPVGTVPVTVVVGEYGQVSVKNGDAEAVAMTGAATADYLVAAGKTLTIAVTPATGVAQPDGTTKNYQIDSVYVNGVLANVSGNSAWNSGTSTLTLSGLTEAGTVVVTFRPEGSDKPIQAVVETSVVSGYGAIYATGTNVYTVGDTPSFVLNPKDSSWEVAGLALTLPEAGETVTVKPESNVYTAEPLKAGVTKLQASFAEKTFTVAMSVELNSGLGQTLKPGKTPVTISFTRTAGGDPITLDPVYTKCTFSSLATATVQVPQGTWTVTVSKNGYLNYVITGFEVKEDGTVEGTYANGGTVYFGQKTANGTAAAKPICPTVGDASWDGKLISALDAAQVANGMVSGASQARIERADFTEDATPTVTTDVEMGLVKMYFGNTFTEISYSDFLA